uniref:Uncharacterized protein n=1 Tax=Rhizophora mucronata TaxID=61149 RepID=A0A2P2P7Y2_RHIMU
MGYLVAMVSWPTILDESTSKPTRINN